MVDYYKVLGLSVSATPKQIKIAFRALAFKLHPDKNIGTANASKQDLYRKVSEAYEVLNDVEKRKEYDKQFMFQRGPGGYQQGYDRYQSGSRYHNPANPNRKPSEYHPGGAKHAPRPGQEYAYVSREHFNMHEWNTAHYGEDADAARTGADRPKAGDYTRSDGQQEAGPGGKSGRGWMNMKGNAHQSYYRKKAARDAVNAATGGAASAKNSAAAYAAQAEQMHNNHRHAAENLNRNREERRQRKSDGSSREGPDACVIS